VSREMMRMDTPHVWVARADGSDIVRAEAIVGVGVDLHGNITARVAGGDGASVTLVASDTRDGPHVPDGFHRELIRILAELSDAAGAFIVRPSFDERHGWRWINEPL
jgi:hypothetical protein